MEEISPTSCELSCEATAWRRTVVIHFRFNGARATEYRSCGVRIYKGTCFRSGRFLEFAVTAFVGLIRKWCGWSGRRFLLRKNHWSRPAGVDLNLPLQIATLEVSIGWIGGLPGSPPEGEELLSEPPFDRGA